MLISMVFCNGRSTCSSLQLTQCDWSSRVNAHNIFDVETMVIRKAFDVVWHNKLVFKLADLGIS